jgi:polyphosphate kinase 2 (PPK2 family)
VQVFTSELYFKFRKERSVKEKTLTELFNTLRNTCARSAPCQHLYKCCKNFFERLHQTQGEHGGVNLFQVQKYQKEERWVTRRVQGFLWRKQREESLGRLKKFENIRRSNVKLHVE